MSGLPPTEVKRCKPYRQTSYDRRLFRFLTSSFLSLITTAGTSRYGEMGTPLLFPSLRNVHWQHTKRVMASTETNDKISFGCNKHKSIPKERCFSSPLHLTHPQLSATDGKLGSITYAECYECPHTLTCYALRLALACNISGDALFDVSFPGAKMTLK